MANRTAVITGGGSGIGRATALALLDAEYNVVLAGRNRDRLEETAAVGNGSTDSVLVVPTDVTKPAEVEQLFDATRDRFGRIDLLFNNAGVSPPACDVGDVSYEDWCNVVNVNLTGPFLCTRAAFRWMKQQTPRGGRIINNGSLAATTPRPNSAPYAATKHAITGLTKATSLDGRQFDIACGQIDIGNAETTMASGSATGALQPNGEILEEPLMDVRHVAQAVVHMASLPLDANILFLTVMANGMPFVGRG